MSSLSLLARVLITWLVILPLVLVVSMLLGWLLPDWPAIVRTVLTVTIAVPFAVAWGVPVTASLYLRLRRGRTQEAAAQPQSPAR